MKTLLLFLLLPTLTFAQTNIGGVLSSDTTLLLANSPYIVTNNLLVQQGKKVTVESGVVFKFNQGIYLQVDGEFQAIGTPADSILFTINTATGATTWGGIRFTNTAADFNPSNGSGCRLNYCIIESARVSPGTTNPITAIKALSGIIQISFCELRHNQMDINVGAPSYITNNKIHDGISATGFIQGNEFINTGANIGAANFIGNYIHGSSIAISVATNSTISSNIIENNTIGILLIGGDSSVITCNTFNNDSIHLAITCERHPLVANNNFLGLKNKGWNVYWAHQFYFGGNYDCNLPSGSGVYATIDLSNNYWRGLTNAQMDSSIWDFNDDFSLQALIAYTPTIPDTVDYSTVNCYTVTAITENTIQDKNVNPFPNPFSTQLTFTLADNEQTTVSLYNFLGQQVLQQTFTNSTTINTEQLADGIYFYELRNNKGTMKTGKVVKQ